MRTKIISMILLVAMIFSVAAMGMLSSSAAGKSYPYHEASHWTTEGGINDQDYTFAFVGDIQKLTEIDYLTGKDSNPDNDTHHVDTLFTWIANNAQDKKIKHVFTLGDLTEYTSADDADLSYSPGTQYGDVEWQMVKNAITKLDGIVPYSVVRGNHDDYQIDDFFNYEAYKSNFDGFYAGEHALPEQAEREATYYTNSITNSYRLVEIGGTKYIFITLDFNPTRGVVTWLDNLLTQYSDHKAIITMHSYTWRGTNADGTPGNGALLTAQVLQKVIVAGKAGGASPDYIWKYCIKKHSNVIMTVSGHVGANDPFFFKQTGDNGNEVLNVLVNPQSYEDQDNNDHEGEEKLGGFEPTGMVFLMHFYDGGKTIKTEYYSTILDAYKRGDESVNGSNYNLWTLNDNNTWTLDIYKSFAEAPATEATTTTVEETTTTAASTEATAEATTASPEANGCKSSVSLVAIALLPAFATFSAVSFKKRKENE